MKPHLTLLFALIFFGCKQHPKSAISALKFPLNPVHERIGLDPNLLKYVKHASDVLVLRHATLIDGRGTSAKENQTLIVVNGYFHAIGHDEEIEIPQGATEIDLTGKTIIPGMVGVHNHLHIPGSPFVGKSAAKLYLASGVTTIQTCGSASPHQEIELSKKIEQGNHIGPNIITSGPYFTGQGGNPNMIIPRSANHIRDTMQYYLNQGVRWFKVYRHTRPEDLKVIIDEAHKREAKVRGHLCSITFEQAVKWGIDGIEHGLNSASDFRTNKNFGRCDGSRAYMDELDIESEQVKELLQLMIDHQVFLTSTLAIYESSIPKRAVADERSLNTMAPYLTAQYHEHKKALEAQENHDNTRAQRLRRIMDFEYQFYKMGGTLTAGADAGRHVLPGFGDQRNFELLREAGFTTEEAIKIMTSNGAKILADQTIGSVVQGKKADFVIIEGSVKDHIRNVVLVFKDGYGYDPKVILTEMEGQFGVE